MPGRGGGSCTLRATTVVAVIMTRGAMTIIIFAIAGLRGRRRGWQFIRAIRMSLVRGEPSFERNMVVSYVRAAPPLVAAAISGSLPVFLAKRPFTVDAHTLRAVGVGLGFWW